MEVYKLAIFLFLSVCVPDMSICAPRNKVEALLLPQLKRDEKVLLNLKH